MNTRTVQFLDSSATVLFSRNYPQKKYFLTAAKEAKIYALEHGFKCVKWLKIDGKYIDFQSINVSGLQLWYKEHKKKSILI